ncbi:alpha/beta fold hydrolase [Streptomyces sp. NPDC051561]|uniref:alpha/beta fold hydrolase n=1 Tax=Streptomyces sp. NPDC051561 TaxID=3365658 RepID=UPI003798E61A
MAAKASAETATEAEARTAMARRVRPRTARPSRHALSSLALGLAATLALTACGGGGGNDGGEGNGGKKESTKPSARSSPPPVEAPQADWEDCPLTGQPTRECATLKVPVDFTRPDAGTTGLAVSRLPATDRKRRLGVLVTDPGGPGLQGRYTQANLLPPQFRALFDIVGFDRRGSHASTPVVDCGEPGAAVERVREAEVLDPAAVDVPAVTAGTTKYAAACTEKYGALTAHLGTKAVAKDLEAIRKALGEDKLNLLFLSYGTLLGQEYLATHPDRVRAAVLDGVVDPARTGAAEAISGSMNLQDADSTRDKTGARRRAEQIRGALSGFLPWCKGAGPAECALADDPAKAVEKAFTLHPDLVKSVNAVAYDPARWPEFARAVDDADAGGPNSTVALKKIAALPLPKDLAEVLKPAPANLAFDLGNKCTDYAWPRNTETLLQEVAVAAKAAGNEPAGPTTGADFAACAQWPGTGSPLGALKASAGPRPLLVNTEKDPRTPLAGAEKVAARMKAPLLRVGGDLHGITSQGNECVQSALLNTLVKGNRPVAGNCPT